MFTEESLERSEVEGRVVILLNSLTSIDFEDYISKAKEDFLNLDNTHSREFFANNTKPSKKALKTYPAIFTNDLDDPKFSQKYKERFNRLKAMADSMYHFKVEHTLLPLKTILDFSERNKTSRLLVFHANNLVRDYQRILKIFKLNSFLCYREINFAHAANLYIPNGFIRQKKVDSLLQGKGKEVNDFTFKALELELDKKLNETPVHYITGTDAWEKDMYGDFFAEKPISLLEREEK
ncbi:MAG: hypothetical protein AAF518_11655 [Spirochaetota bacterium]